VPYGSLAYQTTSADTVWYQSVTSHCCPVTATGGSSVHPIL